MMFQFILNETCILDPTILLTYYHNKFVYLELALLEAMSYQIFSILRAILLLLSNDDIKHYYC